MQKRAFGRNWKTLKIFVFLVGVCCYGQSFIADKALAADSGTALVVNSGENITVDGRDYANIDINSGGSVTVPQNVRALWNISSPAAVNNGTITVDGFLGISSTGAGIFTNNGMINIPGTGTSTDSGGELQIAPAQLNNFIDNGLLTIGGKDAKYEVKLRMDGGTAIAPVTLSSAIFNPVESAANAQKGKLNVGNFSRIRFGQNPLILTGNNLDLSPATFDKVFSTESTWDESETFLPEIGANSITLQPASGNLFTLSSGVIKVGTGDPRNTGELQSSLKVGDGNGTLHINGGMVRVGGRATREGLLEGNVIIGTDKTAANPDSAFIARVADWTITGDLTLNKSGYLKVGDSIRSETGESLQSSLTVNKDFHFNGGKYEVADSKFHVKGKTIGDMDAKLVVSDSGTLILTNLIFNGGHIAMDPEFIAAGDTSNASMAALGFDSNNVDARINVGRNSMATLGSDDPEWLRTKIGEYQNKNNLLWGRDVTAALAIRSPQKLAANGGLNVDGTWTTDGNPASANVARFADKSLFVIDASGLNNQAALDGNGSASLEVEKGAKLLITDAALGDTIRVTNNFASSNVSVEGWSSNTATTTDVQNVESLLIDPVTGEYVVRIKEGKNPAAAFPLLSSELAAVVAAASNSGFDANSPAAGLRFISRAVDNRYIGNTDAALAAATIESAARIAVIGAVPQMAKAANEAAGAAITQRTSLAQPSGAIQAIDQNGEVIHDQGLHAKSFSLWIMPLYQSTNGFGLEAGNFDYDFNGALGGVALGADYTFESMIRLGLSFNIGGGYAQGTGDLNKTTSNMNFWGLGAYAGWTKNNFGLAADINFTSTYNKVKQELPSQMQMSDLKSDITAWAISTGLRAEYKLETAYLDIIPHVGFRFLNLNTDSYDVNSNGTVLEGDSFTQNIWTFPIGLSFTKNYELENGWQIKPLLDLNITPATGDIKAKTNVRFTGINQEAEIDTKMMDYITYGGTAGIEFGNDTVKLGINYNGQFGAESSAHGIFGTFRYEF